MTSMNALFDTAVQSLGGIDAVINVAGIQRSASIEETDEPSWDAHFNVNAKSCFAAAKFAVPHLRRAGGGSFVSVASIAGIKGMAGLGAYSASKGAIVALTRSLAVELAPDNIRVNCLCPGWIDTPFNDPIISFMGGPAARDTMVSTSIPLRRQGEPPEMAAALTYLASDESSFMTGQALVIDGGMTV